MKPTLSILSLFCAAFLVAGCSAIETVTKPSASATESWTTLFNGKDLTNFYPFVNKQPGHTDPEGYFKVEEGVIHILGLPATQDRKEFGYLATDKEYSNFHFRAQFKWGKNQFAPRIGQPRDSGVLYLMTGADKIWPDSIECQVQEKDVGEMIIVGNNLNITVPVHMRGNQKIFDPAGTPTSVTAGRVYKTPVADSLTDWNTIEVMVKGNSSVHIVNGTVMMMLPDIRLKDGKPLTSGKILLQAEGAEIFYRNIEIRPLRNEEMLPTTKPST